MSQGPRTLTPITYSVYQVWRTTWLHDSPPLRPSGVCQSWTWKGWRGGGELLGRGEVGTLGQKPPGFKTVKRLDEEKGLAGAAQNSRFEKQTKLLLPCIHGNHLRTNLSPCWDLLFLQRKWLKEVKVRKPRIRDETSRHSSSVSCTLENLSHWKYQWTVSHYLDTK